MSYHPTATSAATTTRRSYPPPEHPLDRTLRVPPPPSLPYRPPPGPAPPPLPCRAALPLSTPAGWTVTHHAVPAAYPRRFGDSFGSLTRESAPQTLEDSSDTRAEGKEKEKEEERGREESKEERRARHEGEAREMLRMRYDSAEYPNLATDWDAGAGTGTDSEGGEKHKGLWMAAERWTRSDSDSASAGGQGEEDQGDAEAERVTLVVTHANGLHKEMWYPTLHRLLAHPLSTSTPFGEHRKNERHPEPSTPTPGTRNVQVPVSVPVQIDEIWLFDDIHHGASLDLNAGRIGPVHGWSDGGRDVVNFLAHVWKGEGVAVEVYPEQALDWREQREQPMVKLKATAIERPRSRRRKVIGVGHSFGGNALVQAAAERPDLFHALFLVDPMCPAHAPPRSSLNMLEGSISKYWPLVMGAIKRRSHWPSLDAARALRRAPFFGAWDEEVWEIFLSHGLVPGPNASRSLDAGDMQADGAGRGRNQDQGQGQRQGQGQDQGVQLATPGWAEAAVFGEPTGLCEGWERLLDIPAEVAVGFLMANEPRATFGEEMTREMVWRAPGSVNEIVPDAGHLERPDRVADALGRFLGMVVGGNAGVGPRAKL